MPAGHQATPHSLTERFCATVCSTLQRWLLRSVLLLPGVDGVLRELLEWYLAAVVGQQKGPRPQVFGLVLVTSVGLNCIQPDSVCTTTTPDVLTKAFSWAKESENLNTPLSNLPYSAVDSIDEDDEVATEDKAWVSWASGRHNCLLDRSYFPLSWSVPGYKISGGQHSSTGEYSSLEYMDEQPHVSDGKETFVLERTIAKGGKECRIIFARCADRDGQVVAIKRVKTPEHLRQHVRSEIKCLEKITENKVPFVTPLILSWEDKSFVYLVMPFYYQNMHDRTQQISNPCDLEETRLYFAELVDAVYHIHSLGIIHRDIKLENVLIAPDGRASLADFGLAICTEDFETLKKARCKWWAGTAHYMAPEVLALKSYPEETRGQSYNYKCDIWSLGIAMQNLYAPFRRTEGRVTNPEDPFCLIHDMLQEEPSLRPDAMDLMLYPYLAYFEQDKLRRGEYPHKYIPFSPMMPPI